MLFLVVAVIRLLVRAAWRRHAGNAWLRRGAAGGGRGAAGRERCAAGGNRTRWLASRAGDLQLRHSGWCTMRLRGAQPALSPHWGRLAAAFEEERVVTAPLAAVHEGEVWVVALRAGDVLLHAGALVELADESLVALTDRSDATSARGGGEGEGRRHGVMGRGGQAARGGGEGEGRRHGVISRGGHAIRRHLGARTSMREARTPSLGRAWVVEVDEGSTGVVGPSLGCIARPPLPLPLPPPLALPLPLPLPLTLTSPPPQPLAAGRFPTPPPPAPLLLLPSLADGEALPSSAPRRSRLGFVSEASGGFVSAPTVAFVSALSAASSTGTPLAIGRVPCGAATGAKSAIPRSSAAAPRASPSAADPAHSRQHTRHQR